MPTTFPDIIDRLAGLEPGSKVAQLRARRPVTKENAQASYLALFAPEDATAVSLTERFAVATFVARLHGDEDIARFYQGELITSVGRADLGATLLDLATLALGRGPYGRYPAGPLSVEDSAGPVFTPAAEALAVLGPRLGAALAHAHLLVFHPRDARAHHLQQLLTAGWTTTGIVTLSQLVAFLAFQIRVVAGLKLLTAA
jgi:CMD domain protein